MSLTVRLAVLTAVLWLTGALTLHAQSPEQKKAMATLTGISDSFERLSNYLAPAVVQVFAVGYRPGDAQTTASILTRQYSTGSGVIVDADGYIVTNRHVVEGADQVEVQLVRRDGERTKSRSILRARGERLVARVLGSDRETDLALLKVDETGLHYLPLGDSDVLRQGQLVLAYGSPLGLQNSVSMGIVSAIARQLRPEDPMVYIQTDAPINPGNSGGPLVNTNGEVVGINTFILSQSGGNEGLGFAAPSNIVRAIYQQLRTNGVVRRGRIGVYAQTITPAMAKGLALPQDWGVLLGDVFPGSPAKTAGLQSGDIVLAMDGKRMENGRQFNVNLYRHTIGEMVQLEILRNQTRLNVSVGVIEREDDPERFNDLVDPQKNLVPELGVLAIDIDSRVEKLLQGLRKRFGVLVAAISGEAIGDEDGLRPGDVIYAVNTKEIVGLSGLREELRRYGSGDVLVLHLQRQQRLLFLTLNKP